ncbi:MAG TPA: tetratricopeptide repeat protein [bacterium]|nr:tetratricopeptide repeat protein [bacterium]
MPPSEQLIKYEAVHLFLERAIGAHSAFAITDRNARAIARLCHQLDGIPLALEMAAAWVRVLTVDEILDRLSDRFRLLTSGSRVAVSRHQTLRTAMDWSYELLSAAERALLCRLSVFAGGWTLEASEAVCAENGVERSAVLSLLTKLADKSLVIADTRGGETRYRLLETIRQYGRDRLMESGESADAQARHRNWYLEWAERVERKLLGPEQVAWLARLEMEHGNFRAALEWCRAEEEGAEAWLRLAGALREFWHMRGHHSEGREWLENGLAISGRVSTSVRAKANYGAGILTRSQDIVRGEELLREGFALFREVGDVTGIAYSLHHLAHVAAERLNYDRAVTLFEESLTLFREAGDRWGVGWSLHCLGMETLNRGYVARAKGLLGESLSIVQEVGNTYTLAYLYHNLGIVAERQGDYKRAAELLEKALTITRLVGDKGHTPGVQCSMAKVLLCQGDQERAGALYRESLILRREIGDRPRFAESLEGLAGLAGAQGHHERAARILGAAEALREATGYQRFPLWQTDHDERVASVRDALEESVVATCWAEGRAMTVEQLVEYALAPTETPQPKGKEPAKSVVGKRVGALAPREWEVAVLIAEGKTNRAIAAHLSITEGTAEAHVQHILNKLGFNSRAQIAAWAVEHGLRTASPSSPASPDHR